MSRLLRDRLLVSLAPGAIALVRIARGLHPRIVAKQVIDCDPAFGAEPWRGAVAALAAAVDPLRGGRMKVTVVLSNEFVRYAVVPCDAKVTGRDEELALARFHFARIYGERAKAWDIRMSEDERNAPRLASALDAGLVDAIYSCFPPTGKLELVSVQPFLMSAFNLWCKVISSDAWLLLVEPRRICLALLHGQKWIDVQAMRGEFSTAEDWAVLLNRQRLRTNEPAATNTVFVHAADGRNSPIRDANGWKFVRLAAPPLDGFLPLHDGRLTMALSAR